MIIDDIGWHLSAVDNDEFGRSFGQASAIPGIFLTWCVNLGLISDEFARREEIRIMRLKYRDITGGEFLVSACGGTLDEDMLSAKGMSFARDHYKAFELAVSELIEIPIEDGWAHYDRMAPWLTEKFLGQERSRKRATKQGWWRWRK